MLRSFLDGELFDKLYIKFTENRILNYFSVTIFSNYTLIIYCLKRLFLNALKKYNLLIFTVTTIETPLFYPSQQHQTTLFFRTPLCRNHKTIHPHRIKHPHPILTENYLSHLININSTGGSVGSSAADVENS